MTILTFPANDASRIEHLVMRHIPMQLTSAGFALNETAPCKRLLALVQDAIRHLSQHDALRIAAELEEENNKKTRIDWISICVEEQISLHAQTLVKFSIHIADKKSVEDIIINRIKCSEGIDHAFTLGFIYQREIDAFNARRPHKPKSKKFQNKHKNKSPRRPWPINNLNLGSPPSSDDEDDK